MSSQLVKHYRDCVGDTTRAPRIVADHAAIMRFNLPADAGFLLSFVDGSTTVDEVGTLCALHVRGASHPRPSPRH
ncbi:MAG: hypothetical protein HRU01_18070 [Myxococcales bacterium]|nr:hypothetical protein [Myxococcales bacterium]